MERAFIWVFDHHLAIFTAAIVAGVAILALIRRPRRWFHWAIDAVVVIVIAVASLAFWFFTNVTKALEHRTNTLTYVSLDAADAHRVADLRGNVVVLNYWATWCGPCRAEMPDLSRLADAYRGKGVVVLTISDEAPEQLQKFLAKVPQRTTVARFTSDAPQGKVQGMAYRGRPTTLVLGRDGGLRRMFLGKRSYEDFDAAVRASM
jgi:thiol-disulfide isomerase/thioredoxin